MNALLDADGQVGGDPTMTEDQVVEAFTLMLRSRAIDDICTKLQRLGRIGLYAPVTGQEATVVGSAMALEPDRDWLVPASREHPAMLRHGFPLRNLLAYFMGRAEYAVIPPHVRVLPRQQAIAAQLPHAAGLAWAMKLRGDVGAVMVYCGDGASSEGDFHEALNLAGVMSVPLVVVLVNNGYAISTPVSKQTAATSLAARGEGYGMPGLAVDGNDLFAVYSATRTAVSRAMSGEGPTLIECRTYRLGVHNTSDNPRQYRSREEERTAWEVEPIARLEKYILSTGVMSLKDTVHLRDQIRQELLEAIKEVQGLPRPAAEFIFQHVFAER